MSFPLEQKFYDGLRCDDVEAELTDSGKAGFYSFSDA